MGCWLDGQKLSALQPPVSRKDFAGYGALRVEMTRFGIPLCTTAKVCTLYVRSLAHLHASCAKYKLAFHVMDPSGHLVALSYLKVDQPRICRPLKTFKLAVDKFSISLTFNYLSVDDCFTSSCVAVHCRG